MNVREHAEESGRIIKWLAGLESDPLAYYTLEFNDTDSGLHAPLMLSASYIENSKLNPSLEIFELVEQKLILDMYISGVIHQAETAAGCNWRLKLLGWYHSLTVEEKLSLPIFGNKLSIRRGVMLVPGFESIQYSLSSYESVRDAYNEINEDLRSLGAIAEDYMTVRERLETKEPYLKRESQLPDFKRLKRLDFRTLDDLERPSVEKPFNDMKHAFAIASLKTASDSGELNYLEAFNHVSRLLIERGFTGVERMTETLDVFSLPRFRSHLEQKIVVGDISPSAANSLMSSFRKTLAVVQNLKNYAGGNFVNSQGFDADRVTDAYRPYSIYERVRISTNVDEDIARNNALAMPYRVSGIGADPLDKAGKLVFGMGTLENARWIFENKLNCQAVSFKEKNSQDPYVSAFISIIARAGVSIRAIVEDWGAHYLIDGSVIAPYAIKLAQVTGLNADSLRFLKLDDYVSKHPLTGRPCLKYWKERSDGEKLMPLDLFESEISWLTASQSQAVNKIFDDVRALTADIRRTALQDISNDLFIWQSSAARAYREIKSFANSKSGIMREIFASYAKRKSLVDDAGAPLRLTPSRLRPSFISELVDRNVPIQEIQMIMGHKTIATTLAYLDRMDFNHSARSKLDVALRKLHGDTVGLRPVDQDGAGRVAAVDLIGVVQISAPEVVFKTPLASCRNIFNPPDFVKRLSSYVPGRPCAMYNMCLRCENVMLTSSDLPQLFAMERDYLKALEVVRIMDTPYGKVVGENLALLKQILGDKSDFTIEELAEGRRLAEFVDTTILVDGVGL